MTELQLYKRAYAVLVGRVDSVITRLETALDGMPPAFTAGVLKNALEEAEELFLAEDPEEG